MQTPRQPKRTLTPSNFVETAAKFGTSLPVLVRALRSPKTSAALREQTFLAVTAVNECRYCKWAHTHWAMDQGVTLKRINHILDLQIGLMEKESPAEDAAILFAQHYAERRDRFDSESIEQLRKYYSDAQVAEIIAYVHFITFTNLLGNAADAFLGLLHMDGNNPSVFVCVVGATAAPFALLLLVVAKFDRTIGIDRLSPWRSSPSGASLPSAINATSKSGPNAPPKQFRKAKRTLTPGNLFRTVANVVASAPVLLAGFVRPKTSAALREKVVLGVTSINDCRLCEWGHTHWALANGVPLDEVNQILGLEIESLQAKNPAEAAAILFAQHYAERRDQFDPESLQNLRRYYSDDQVREILAYVRAITLGSLTGNTVDAFLRRFRGDGQKSSHHESSIVFEGLVTAAVAPVLLVLALLAKFARPVSLKPVGHHR